MKRTIVNRILVTLAQAPATSRELAIELGMSHRNMASQCHHLFKSGRVTRRKIARQCPIGHSTVFLYEPRGRRGVPV